MKGDPSRVLTLVEEALDSGRTPEVVCADCPELLANVQRLWEQCLRIDFELDELFSPSSPPTGLATSLEGPGVVVGPYTLLQQIGEGGFGTVYLAEQAWPVRRRVALKVVKPGMDTRDVIARFEAERQALAMMDHPNIARVFDAGATDSGRPYFVMELVDGVPIVAYCDARRMPTRSRLELMVLVCRAVQSAHQKGVIHRDLKPSNVLVATQDGDPVPKVIDFGIAKATASSLTDRTLLTAVGGFVGTPAYMSPEQAETSGLGIDTRTDVYALGVLLYELLTGTTPIDPVSLKAASHGEVVRLIRESEPPKPSVRLSNFGEALANVAIARGTDPRRLGQVVRGELDWIVMKALEKDRTRRYDSAAALADDLARYLAGEPVAAGPPGGAYRLRKFARKHRAALGVAALIAAALLIGVAGTTIGLVREARQRRLAEGRQTEADAQRRTAQAVVEFLTEDVLAHASPGNTKDKAISDTLVKALIEPALQTIGERFRDDPVIRAAVRATLARTLLDLGRFDLAMPQARAAWQERQKALGDDHLETIRALGGYLLTLEFQGRHAEAEPLARQAWERSRRVLGDDHPIAIFATYRYGLNLKGLGRLAESEPLMQQAWRRSRRALGDDHPETIRTMAEYGLTLSELGRHAEAEPLLRGAWERDRRVLGDDHPSTITTLRNYSWFLQGRGRHAEAEPLARQACERYRRVLGDGHPETSWSENIHALTLAQLGRHAEAEPLLRGAWERDRRVLGDDHPETIIVLRNYAAMPARSGRWAEAEPLYRQVWESTRRVLGDLHLEAIEALSNYALTLANLGRLGVAKAPFVEAVAANRQAGRAGEAPFANLLFAQADFLRQVGDPAGAIPPLREATDLLRAVAPDDPNRGRDLYWLGTCLMATGRPADAEPVFRENYLYDLKRPDPDRKTMPGSLEGLIASLKAQGKPADAPAIRSEFEADAMASVPPR